MPPCWQQLWVLQVRLKNCVVERPFCSSDVYILIINLCLFFIIKCYPLCINACFRLIILFLMLWFELSLKNAFELRNKEEHLMGFVSRDRTEFVSHLLTLILYASHLGRLVKGLIVWSMDIDSFHSRDRGLSIFVSRWL